MSILPAAAVAVGDHLVCLPGRSGSHCLSPRHTSCLCVPTGSTEVVSWLISVAPCTCRNIRRGMDGMDGVGRDVCAV